MKSIEVGYRDKKIYLLGTIKGLTVERKTVAEAFRRSKPDVIALHVSEEDLVGLEKVVKGKIKKVGLSRYEEVYARKLATIAQKDPHKYGEVQVPPPAVVEGFELGGKNNVPVVAFDMNENEFTNAFVKNISTVNLIWHSVRFNRVRKKKFKATTPEEFVLEWDKVLTKLKGFKNLELRREKYMANRLFALSKKYNKILAVTELERMEGIVNNLKRLMNGR
ncbi:MAG: hypothetical protein KAJ51_09020 [Thermoplasmata archaeon]|nr:hypothetical protein [Thermoplasmata archaeon]